MTIVTRDSELRKAIEQLSNSIVDLGAVVEENPETIFDRAMSVQAMALNILLVIERWNGWEQGHKKGYELMRSTQK